VNEDRITTRPIHILSKTSPLTVPHAIHRTDSLNRPACWIVSPGTAWRFTSPTINPLTHQSYYRSINLSVKFSLLAATRKSVRYSKDILAYQTYNSSASLSVKRPLHQPVTCSHAPHNDVSVNDGPHTRQWSHNIIVQGDKKCSVHLMITAQRVTSNVQSVPRQSPHIWH
jgi:hypothetical protein